MNSSNANLLIIALSDFHHGGNESWHIMIPWNTTWDNCMAKGIQELLFFEVSPHVNYLLYTCIISILFAYVFSGWLHTPRPKQ